MKRAFLKTAYTAAALQLALALAAALSACVFRPAPAQTVYPPATPPFASATTSASTPPETTAPTSAETVSTTQSTTQTQSSPPSDTTTTPDDVISPSEQTPPTTAPSQYTTSSTSVPPTATTPPTTTTTTTTTPTTTTTTPPATTTSSGPQKPIGPDAVLGAYEDVVMGVDVYEVPGQARIDYSNISEGYVLVSYLGSDTSKKLKISVLTPNKKSYNFYNLSHDGSYTIIPLTEGNGSYQVTVSKTTTGSIYSRLASKTFDVTLKDEFAPFRHSNQYVNYSKYGKVAEKARQLTANSTSELQSLQLIYNFVVNYLTYDYTKAAAATAPGAVTSDFIPD